jgi:hypothetical protein
MVVSGCKDPVVDDAYGSLGEAVACSGRWAPATDGAPSSPNLVAELPNADVAQRSHPEPPSSVVSRQPPPPPLSSRRQQDVDLSVHEQTVIGQWLPDGCLGHEQVMFPAVDPRVQMTLSQIGGNGSWLRIS